MKRLALFVAICVLVAMSVPAFAADVKVGVIDLIKVIDLSEPGKKAKTELESKLTSAETAVKKKQEEILKMKEDIEKQAPMLSATALAEKKRQYEDELLELQRMAEDYDYQLQNQYYELTAIIFTQLSEVIEDIGKSGGYTLILEKNGAGVIYFPESIDITEEIIKELNKK
jgi:outer membrane protein